MIPVLVVLLVSSLLNAAYFLPIVYRGFFAPLPEGSPAGVKEAPLLCLIPLSVTALGSLSLFFYPDLFLRLIRQALFP
jgi:multicomponent Na+:H+ antiporter subunit D